MKKVNLLKKITGFVLLLCCFGVKGWGQATYTWSGASLSSWTTASNWTPARNSPATNDILEFNTGTALTVIDVPTETIGKLLVSNTNTSISLRATVTGGNTITISGGANSLSVAAGTTLNFTAPTGTFPIIMNLATGSTGSISGNMAFSGMSSGSPYTGSAHRLTAEDASGITFNSGAIFTQQAQHSGSPFGTTVPANTVIFASGSTYRARGGSAPFALTQPASKVVFQPGSNYIVQGNFAPGFSGRTYGNFEIDAATFSQSSTGGAVLNITGNLTITQATTFNLNLTGGINIGGNITRTSGSVSFSPASAANLTLNGTGDQTISGAITFSSNINLVINKVSGLAILGSSYTINRGLTLTSGTLAIGANTLTLAGTTPRTNGFLRGSSSSNISITGTGALGTLYFDQTTDGTTNVLNNFTLNRTTSGTATLGNKLVITGALTPTDGTLTTGGFLTLRSTATNTARVAALGSGASITGDVTVERFLPGRRSWRLLTAPVTQSTPSTLDATWKNLVDIVGPSGSNLTQTMPGYNFLTYNSTTDAWANIDNPAAVNLTGTSLNNAFCAFIPGPVGNSFPTIGDVTLTSTGSLLTGNKSFSSSAPSGHYILVPNPYASPISLETIFTGSTGISPTGTIYTWDPRLSGGVGTGGYVSIQRTGVNTYNITGGTTDQTHVIQSGQAFFVQANAASQSINFTEAAKDEINVNTVFGVGTGSVDKLRIGFNTYVAGTPITIGEVLATYASNYNKAVSFDEDAEKLWNNEENIALKRGNYNLSIESRPFVGASNDTIFLGLSSLRANTNYSLEFKPSNWDAGSKAYLVDKTLNTETLIDLNATSFVHQFTSTVANANDRFIVVFRGSTLPLRNFSFSGEKLGTNKVKLNWDVQGETGVKEYTVQKSTDGVNFQVVTTQNAKNGNTNSVYSYVDNAAVNGVNYYRIKTTQLNDIETYSSVVTINFKQSNSAPLTVYPNPVKGNVIGLQLQDITKGTYSLRIVSVEGKEVYKQQLAVGSSSINTTVNPSTKLAKGTYTLQLQGNGSNYVQKIVVE